MIFTSRTFISVVELCLLIHFHTGSEALEPATITFENKCPFTVNINWYNGKTKNKYFSLKHGQRQEQSTFVTHTWSATDKISGVKQLLDGVPLFTVQHHDANTTVNITKVTGVAFSTQNSQNYVVLSTLGISCQHKFIEFSVQACGDVQITLMSDSSKFDVLYEINIGEGNNTHVGKYIRGKQPLVMVNTTTGPLVQCKKYTTFHISWKSNITLGHGNYSSVYPNGNDMYTLPSTGFQNIKNVGVSTPRSTGKWKFYVQSGGWGDWKPFGTCSVTCGNGSKPYVRRCGSPVPGTSVSNCIGNNIENRPCVMPRCNGKWKNWELIGTCSVTCGNGSQPYVRRCRSTVPGTNVSNCIGNNTKNGSCAMPRCHVFKWGHLKGHNLSRSQLKDHMKEELDQLTKKLKIDKKNTTYSVRRRTSAPDDRPSAVAVGYFGTAMLIIPVLLMVFCDVTRCLSCLKSRTSKISNRSQCFGANNTLREQKMWANWSLKSSPKMKLKSIDNN